MITLKNMSFGYGKGLLYDDLTTTFQTGRIYGLLGKNGAGKTTLFKLMCGLLRPRAGSCTVCGMPAVERQPGMLGDICYVPERFHVPAMPVAAYVTLHAPLYPHFNHDRFSELLAESGVEASARLNRLSYGQRKKFSLAFGIASGCRVMLLDEPTNGLDIPSKRVLRRQLAGAMDDDRVIVIATHQVREVENIFDTVVIVDNGRIMVNRTMDDIARAMSVKTVVSLDECPGYHYAEEVPGGYSVIVPNGTDAEGAMSIELLFSAVVNDHTVVEVLSGADVPAATGAKEAVHA